MRDNQKQKNKLHTIYGIYDIESDNLIAVSLDYDSLKLQMKLSDLDTDSFDIIEFDIDLVQE